MKKLIVIYIVAICIWCFAALSIGHVICDHWRFHTLESQVRELREYVLPNAVEDEK